MSIYSGSDFTSRFRSAPSAINRSQGVLSQLRQKRLGSGMLEASHTYGFEGSHDGVFGSLGVTQFECSADIDCGSLVRTFGDADILVLPPHDDEPAVVRRTVKDLVFAFVRVGHVDPLNNAPWRHGSQTPIECFLNFSTALACA